MTVAGSVTSVGPSTYGHLTLSGAGIKTAASAITVAGNLPLMQAHLPMAEIPLRSMAMSRIALLIQAQENIIKWRVRCSIRHRNNRYIWKP